MSNDPKSLMKQGEECLKTNWLKWEVDHLAASIHFEQAARLFLQKGDGESAYGAYLKAAKSHLSKGGKGHEAAALAYQNAGKAYPSKAAEMLNNTVDLFISNNNIPKAIDVLGLTAEALEKEGDEDGAITVLLKASDLILVDVDERKNLRRGMEIMEYCLKRLVKHRRFMDAVKIGNKLLSAYKISEKDLSKRQLILGLVIIHLARGDIAAGRQLVNGELDSSNFAMSNEGNAAQDLLDAWEKFDSVKVKKLTSTSTFTGLEQQMALLSQEIVPGGTRIGAPPPQQGGESSSEQIVTPSKKPAPALPSTPKTDTQDSSTTKRKPAPPLPTPTSSTTPVTTAPQQPPAQNDFPDLS